MKAILKIILEYNEGQCEDEARDHLDFLANHAASNGFFIGDSPTPSVKSWSHEVETGVESKVVADRIWVYVKPVDGQLPGWTDSCLNCGSEMVVFDDDVVRCLDDDCDFEHTGEYRTKSPLLED